ncbi:MAM and LDL-receptor class A domain-containing protein 1-like [Saccoglossus kowalevskii]
MEEIERQAILDRENGVVADGEFHRPVNRISEYAEERHRILENERNVPSAVSRNREDEDPADLQVSYQKDIPPQEGGSRKTRAKRNAEEGSINSINAACDEIIDQDLYELKSPNYPNVYDPNLLCTYSINVPVDKTLELEFTDFSVEYCGDGCTCDSLSIKGIPHCGDTLPGNNGLVNYATDGIHELIFQTDGNTQQRGFSVTIRRIPVVITPQPHLCDFELDGCGYQQGINDNQDWTRKSGPTDSTDTGPSVDHTTGTAQGYYIYVEGSIGLTGYTAQIASPVYEASPTANCLRFWYHMYGASMGTLSVYINDDDNVPLSQVFTATGDHGDVWLEAEVDFQVDGRYSVIFENTRGGGYQSDLAIDDIQLSREACNLGPPVIDCDGDFIWDFGVITSPAYPALYPENSDCSYRIHIPEGYYAEIWYRDVAIELCAASCPCDRLIMNSNALCGTTANLTDYLAPDANGIHEITFQSDWSVEFGGFYAEITILPGRPTHQIPMSCDFESMNVCGFVQDDDDVFDWTRNMGRTPSSATGPQVDHTYGDTSHAYMYIEASSPRLFGDRARLLTPTYDPTFSTLCVGFWYHMYGYDINALSVKLLEFPSPPNDTSITSLLWVQVGEVGNSWVYHEVSFYAGEYFQIAFDGVVGTSYDGDIAIDDIAITEGRCPSSPTVTPSPGPVTPVPECNRYLTDETDQISTPNFPDPYDNNEYCNWTIIIHPSKYGAIYFDFFDLEYSGAACLFDALIVDGNRFCGSTAPGFNGTSK